MNNVDHLHPPPPRHSAGRLGNIELSIKGPVVPAAIFFFAGALLRVDIYAIGRISLGELLLVLVSFGYWGQLLSEARQLRQVRTSLWLMALWIFAVLLSDLVNQTDFDLFLRGIARPFVILSMFAACYGLLRRHPGSIIWFFFGLLISAIGNAVFGTDFRVADKLSSYSYGYMAFTIRL